MEPKDFLTLGISTFSAFLSLFVFIWTIRKDRRKIVVGVSPAFFVYANGEISTQMASIDVINQGRRPVYVKAPALRIPNGQFLSFVSTDDFKKFPKRLDDGESASLRVSDEKLQTIVDYVQAQVQPKLSNLSAADTQPETIEFTNGRKVQYPSWMVERRGHDLLPLFQSAFGGASVVSPPRLVKSLQRVRLISKDIAHLFAQLQAG
jgi:hypothetical protein